MEIAIACQIRREMQRCGFRHTKFWFCRAKSKRAGRAFTCSLMSSLPSLSGSALFLFAVLAELCSWAVRFEARAAVLSGLALVRFDSLSSSDASSWLQRAERAFRPFKQ